MPCLLRAEIPPLRPVYNLDAEYELDRRMAETPGAWRDAFRSSVQAFQISGGSLNIRHLHIEERLKFRFPLLDDRLWFRFRRERIQGLERNDARTDMEFEWNAGGPWFLSLLGDAAPHKADAAAGVAARLGREDGRSLKLAHLWPGFDANYAFRNRSVNEGYEEFYRRAPRESRLSADWISERWSLHAGIRHERTWELHRREFSPASDTVSRGGRFEAEAEARRRGAPWSWGLEGESWREKASESPQPPASPGDRSVVQERHAARAFGERSFGASWRARLAWAAAALRGRLDHPAQPAADRGHQFRDSIFSLSAERALTAKLKVEGAYLRDRQWRKIRDGGGQDMGVRVHRRGKLGLQYDFSERASLRTLGALELDRGESEKFFSFDGWTVQFQAAL